MKVVSGKDETASECCQPPIHSYIAAKQKDLPRLFTLNTQKASTPPHLQPQAPCWSPVALPLASCLVHIVGAP